MAEAGMAVAGNDDLRELRAERDGLRRELGDLRAHLCQVLGLLDREPGPEGLEALRIASDREILATVRRLVVDAAATYDVDKRLWVEIDRLILDGTKIEAIQAIRERFGGEIHDALVMLHRRDDRLRWDRPDAFAKDADSYWDGFDS